MSETFRAIRFSHKIAEKLTESYPSEIVNMYRSMNTCEEIATELELIDNYGITMKVAVTALSNALRQLIPKQEMKKLLTKHQYQAGKKSIRIHGIPLTKEGSQKGAKTRWENMSKKQRTVQSRKAIIRKGTGTLD